ncbi:nucleotide sugar dehydrogenase [Salinibacterium sp. SYSU T00001]|uniref:nucleotide sugar dehydrogenase n=1 Tax=Homoserinimonas sedimenticola TaxID=2986805 RepID=UPI002236141E|nr:nucleotide sugar dehydrogenase [Salinibacterium sedimenticola]MCW4385043.1 nucleotide sugar dehydrogenase [Salinibacterium sedimenticola]
MNVVVIGLGKIGLPLAVQFASAGQTVVGLDVNEAVVESVNRGVEPFPGEAHLQEKLAECTAAGRISATTDYAKAIPGADVIVIVVPLFVDDEARPDFGWMDSATEALAPHLTPGTLVSYETTLPVGTTRTRWKPMLEAGSGLVEGEDFHLVFSPERVLTGRVFEDLRKYPKLVGGLSETGAKLARDFYEAVLQFDARDDLPRANGVWDLGTAEAAEMAKLAETTYRDVNIGLANEFARYADKTGIDIYKVIEACNSQPYSHIHRPGIAVGGHCIPVYPRLYLWNDPDATIVRAARERNAGMPGYAVRMLQAHLGGLDGKRIAVLGAAYRGGVKETAFSGIFSTVSELEEFGAQVSVHDPLYSDEELESLGFTPRAEGVEADAVIVQADHAEYRDWDESKVPGLQVILDGRRALDPKKWRGATYVAIGATTL